MNIENNDSHNLDPGHAPSTDVCAWNVQTGQPPRSTDSTGVSTQLVDANVLPSLELTKTGTADSTIAPTQAAQKNWTIAIDLAATLPSGQGAEDKLSKLEKLAKETEGKPVSFVVHAERLVGDDGNPCTSSDSQNIAACIRQALNNQSTTTERYFIHDGKVEQLPDEVDVNPAGDISSLLKDASNLAPSKTLGLVIESHGEGREGISTNVGDSSLDQTTNAIAAGLANSGHQKLDLLDFDACDMGETQVLMQSQKVANDVVASQAYESAGRSNDGQNLETAMRALLKNPDMTGRDLGNEIVRQAASGSNGKGADNSTQTLANFDLTQYDQFDQKLNQFGAALNQVASREGNMKVLQADIESTAKPDTAMNGNNDHGRDLQRFAQTILASSHAHEFSGDTKPLEDAASALIDSMKPMVTGQFGEKAKGYDKLGGLTIEIPGSEILDSKKVAEEISPLYRFNNKLERVQGIGFNTSSQEAFVDELNTVLYNLPDGIKINEDRDIQKLIADRDNVAQADNILALNISVQRLQLDTKADQKGALGVRIEKALEDKARATQSEYVAAPVEQLGPDWDAFIRRVQATAK